MAPLLVLGLALPWLVTLTTAVHALVGHGHRHEHLGTLLSHGHGHGHEAGVPDHDHDALIRARVDPAGAATTPAVLPSQEASVCSAARAFPDRRDRPLLPPRPLPGDLLRI